MAQKILVNGQWSDSVSTTTFQSVNPRTTQKLDADYPVSPWSEIEDAIKAAYNASVEMRGWAGSRFADFLESYADGIEQRADALVDIANQERRQTVLAINFKR